MAKLTIENSSESFFAPICAPGVFDNEELIVSLFAISHHQNGMTDINPTGEPVDYSIFIISEYIRISAHRNTNRTKLKSSLQLFWGAWWDLIMVLNLNALNIFASCLFSKLTGTAFFLVVGVDVRLNYWICLCVFVSIVNVSTFASEVSFLLGAVNELLGRDIDEISVLYKMRSL